MDSSPEKLCGFWLIEKAISWSIINALEQNKTLEQIMDQQQ